MATAGSTDAIDELMRLCLQLKDAQGGIHIPDFYEGVTQPPHIEDALRDVLKDESYYLKQTGAYELKGEYGYDSAERRWYRPTLEFNGIKGGYIETGMKTVIPASASVKLSMRLVDGQHPDAIIARLRKYLGSIIPKTFQWEFKDYHGALPLHVNHHTPMLMRLKTAIESEFGRSASLHGEGGSIPIMSHFQKVCGVDPLMLGLGLSTDCIHAPNEHFYLPHCKQGAAVISRFLLDLDH